jgi:hypothetical protein
MRHTVRIWCQGLIECFGEIGAEFMNHNLANELHVCHI